MDHIGEKQIPNPTRSCYLGMTKSDLDHLWYAKYWNPHMAPLPHHISTALVAGPQAAQLLPTIDQVASLEEPGYQIFENGFGVTEDGAAVVAALTEMPKVTPAMWDWWFGWHGSDSRRYKLWHPHAHLYATWKEKIDENIKHSDRDLYINRTSWVDEYVGSTKLSLAIRFISPVALGFSENTRSDPEQVTAICGRVGLSEAPIDSGYLVHYVRRTSNGSEMRSRFWLGGKYVTSRIGTEMNGEAITNQENGAMIWQAYSLLAHCAKEMNHLATFLPNIYKDFHTKGE